MYPSHQTGSIIPVYCAFPRITSLSSARQVLVFSVWNVEVGLGVTELLGETNIDDIDLVTVLSNSDQ